MSTPLAQRLIKGTVLSSALFAMAAQAQDYPPAIQSLEQQGVTVLESFEAPGGMTGYVGEMQGRSLAFYLTPDGDQLLTFLQ